MTEHLLSMDTRAKCPVCTKYGIEDAPYTQACTCCGAKFGGDSRWILRGVRAKMGLKRKDLAKLMDVSYHTIRCYEDKGCSKAFLNQLKLFVRDYYDV